MNVLLYYFDPTVNQCARVCEDLERVVKKDEKGSDIVEYRTFDSASYQKSLGLVSDWSLESLVSAGIDPHFAISTGFNSRLEGFGEIERVAQSLESLTSKE